MTLLAPGYLLAAIAAVAATIALHFIVTQRPRAIPFPTARFVPDAPIEAMARALQLSDILLLIIRSLTLLAAGLALAGPVLSPRRERVARVIVADMSGSARADETRDSARALFRPGDAIIVFESSARPVPSPDSLRQQGTRTGSLSAALVAAAHAASGVRSGADSVELVIISPFAGDEVDAATAGIRARWPGRARLVRVAEAENRDISVPTIAWNTAVRPPLASERRRIDTVHGVVSGNIVVIAPFARRWKFSYDSIAGDRVIARWVDGEAAAIEHVANGLCTRSIAVPIDSAGDLPLRPELARFARAMSAPCGASSTISAPALSTTALAGSGRLAEATLFLPSGDLKSPLAPWLIGLAVLLALCELAVRQRRAGAAQ